MPKTTHVVPNPKGGWNVKQGGADRASKSFETKKDATEWARDVSQNQGTELYIHGRDGKIQQKDSHGNDKFPPKG